MSCLLILVMHGLPADFLSVIYANNPSTGAREDWPFTPSLRQFFLLKSTYSYILIFINPLCVECKECYVIENMRNCDYEKGMKVKVPVQDALAGLVGPIPLPPLLR
jgi:hypothetical protein